MMALSATVLNHIFMCFAVAYFVDTVWVTVFLDDVYIIFMQEICCMFSNNIKVFSHIFF